MGVPHSLCITGKQKQTVAVRSPSPQWKEVKPTRWGLASPFARESLNKKNPWTITHLILEEDLICCDKCIEFQPFRLRVDPLILTYLWEETNVNFNQSYRKERVKCYSQRLQPSPKPLLFKVPFAELRVPKEQLVVVHMWFNCPCTGNKIRSKQLAVVTLPLICQMNASSHWWHH